MKLLLLTLGFGTLSAVVPVFNMEVFIAAVALKSHHNLWLLAFAGSLGQNLGKLIWYYTCRGALRIPWLEARLQDPKRQAQFEKWSARVQGRPVLSGAVSFMSALVGIPPFFAIAMIAGTLRMNVAVFFMTGLVGRTIFFWGILAGVGLILH